MHKKYGKVMLILALTAVLAISGCVQTYSSDAECESACREQGYDHGACISNPPNGTLYPVIGACNASVCEPMVEGDTCVCVCSNAS